MTTGSPSLARLASRKSNRCCLVRVVCPRVCNDEWRAGCCDGLKFTALKLLLVLSSIVAFSCALAYYSLFVLGLVDPARLSLDVEHAVKSRLPDIVTRHGDADSNSTDDQTTTTTTPAMLLSSINQRVQSQHIFFVLAQFFVSLTALFSLLYCVRVLNYREGATFTIFYAAVLFLVAAVSVVVCFAAPLDMVSTDNTHGGGVGSNTPTATQWPAYSLAPASNAQLEDPFVSVDASTPEVTARDVSLDAPTTTTTTTGTLAGPAALSTLDVATQYIRNLNLFWCTLVLMFMSLCTLRD